MRTALILTLLIAAAPCLAQDSQAPKQPAAPSAPDASGDPAKIESEVVALLAQGRQREAEYRLRSDAAALAKSQRLAFVNACLARTRFNISTARGLFIAAATMAPESVEGRAANYVVRVDARIETEENFAALEKLVDENPGDPFLRWMAAVLCRELKKNERGVEHYGKLLAVWNPGPGLLHQTYANMLDALDGHEEALVSRRLAVQLEPAHWTFQGLGVTLGQLGQFEEAHVWFGRALYMGPDNAMYWETWGSILRKDKKYDAAIRACRRALELRPDDFKAHETIGLCLREMGQYTEALAEFEECLRINPKSRKAKKQIEWLKAQLAAQPKQN